MPKAPRISLALWRGDLRGGGAALMCRWPGGNFRIAELA